MSCAHARLLGPRWRWEVDVVGSVEFAWGITFFFFGFAQAGHWWDVGVGWYFFGGVRFWFKIHCKCLVWNWEVTGFYSTSSIFEPFWTLPYQIDLRVFWPCLKCVAVFWHLLVDGLIFGWLKLEENCFNNHGLNSNQTNKMDFRGCNCKNLGSDLFPSELSYISFHCPSVSDPMELTSWCHALHRWIPTSYLQVVHQTPPLDGCGFRRSPLGEVMQEFLGVDARVEKMEATRKVMLDHLSHWGMDFNIWHA